MVFESIAAFVPAMYIFLFEGLAYSPYALFNPKYGKWDEVDDLPGMEDQIDAWTGRSLL